MLVHALTVYVNMHAYVHTHPVSLHMQVNFQSPLTSLSLGQEVSTSLLLQTQPLGRRLNIVSHLLFQVNF